MYFTQNKYFLPIFNGSTDKIEHNFIIQSMSSKIPYKINGQQSKSKKFSYFYISPFCTDHYHERVVLVYFK